MTCPPAGRRSLGAPAGLVRLGKVVNTWTLDILDGRVRTIRTAINPDKLTHVGPVADAWAVLRECSQEVIRPLGAQPAIAVI